MKETIFKRKKRVLVLLLVFCSLLFFLPSQAVSGAKREILVSDETDTLEEIFQNTRKQGLIFEITYPEEKMEFLLREPDGTFLKPYTERPGIFWEKTVSGIRLTMEEAKKGSFFLKYPSMYAPDMKVVVKTLKPQMIIRDFKVEEPADGLLSYHFQLEAESSFWYSCQLYLCRKDKPDEKELLIHEGEGYANRMMSGKVSLKGISSGEYALKLCLFVKQREEQKFEEESEVFEYQSADAVLPLEDYEVIVKPEEEKIIVDWSKAENALYDAVFLEMKNEDGTVYRQKFSRNEKQSCELHYEKEMDAELSLVNCDGERQSAAVKRTVNKAGNSVLKLPETSVSREDVWKFSYDAPKPLLLKITGGELEETREVSGEGNEEIKITGEPFDASVSFEDSYGVLWRYERKLSVDKEAPALSVRELYDGYETRLDRLNLEGNTEAGAEVIFNGEELLNDEGYFSVPFVLEEGENPYCIEVLDEAGNVTRMEGSVFRMGALEYLSREEANPVLHLMAGHPTAFIAGLAGILVVLLFVLGFVFCRRWHRITEKTRQKLKEEGRSEEEKDWLATSRTQKHMSMLSNLVLGAAVLATVVLFVCGMVAGYAGQISQLSEDENALPGLLSEIYHVRVTVGEMNLAVRVLFFVALLLYLACIVLKIIASMMRKRLDTLPEDVVRRQEMKAQKRQEKRRRKEEKALKKQEKKKKDFPETGQETFGIEGMQEMNPPGEKEAQAVLAVEMSEKERLEAAAAVETKEGEPSEDAGFGKTFQGKPPETVRSVESSEEESEEELAEAVLGEEANDGKPLETARLGKMYEEGRTEAVRSGKMLEGKQFEAISSEKTSEEELAEAALGEEADEGELPGAARSVEPFEEKQPESEFCHGKDRG